MIRYTFLVQLDWAGAISGPGEGERDGLFCPQPMALDDVNSIHSHFLSQ